MKIPIAMETSEDFIVGFMDTAQQQQQIALLLYSPSREPRIRALVHEHSELKDALKELLAAHPGLCSNAAIRAEGLIEKAGAL